MALVKFGGGVTQMSGSIGGTTFARNRFGNYARARTTPVNPQTANQTAVRSAIAFLAAFWAQTLTALQRTAWDDYAAGVAMSNRLGESIFLSGYNHFLRANSLSRRNDEIVFSFGPTILELPAQDSTLSIAVSEGSQEITLTFDDTMDWADENSARMFVFQGKPQNAQINFFNGPHRFLGALEGSATSGISSPQTIGVDFAVAEGQKQFLYARLQRGDGRVSEPFRSNTIVGA